MERYKYKAINENGRPVMGAISAASESSLYTQLSTAGLELVSCRVVKQKSGFLGGIRSKKITTRDLIQFFVHMEQMQSAGVPLLETLSDITETSENPTLRDIVSDVHRDVSEGLAFSAALARHPKVFKNIYVSLIGAGEDTGDLVAIYAQIVKYLKWLAEMQAKIKKATIYPIIVSVVVVLTIVVMMGFVVPQIVGFLDNLDQELSIFTTSLVATSEFFQAYWWAILSGPFILGIAISILKKVSDGFAYKFDLFLLNTPIAGNLIRKISIARYAQTFGALFASGIDVVSALKAARQTISNKALLEALLAVERYVQSGSSLSEAFNLSGEFPGMIIRMIKIGEESGNLTAVLDQASEFYTQDVDDTIQGLIASIEPALTGILGLIILWIAVAVFGPIYGMLENIDM